MRFRKKPVEVDATQVNVIIAAWANPDSLPAWVQEAIYTGKIWLPREANAIIVGSPEGHMRGDYNDWIIRGIMGELYPCKPDIFAATYEAV